ncbi:AsmA-like C-terminal domain-containing protein [Methylorubrum thiocyanatum]
MTSSTRRPVLLRALLASACAVALLAGPAPSAPAAAQEAASAVQDLVLDNVSLAFGDTLVTAPKVTVSGTRLSRDDLLAILKSESKDAKDASKDSWPARLQRLDAGSLTMPELRVERRDGEKRQVVTYRDVAARTIRAGRISELTAAGATLSVEGAPQSGRGSYGRIRAEEVDLTALARLYSEAGSATTPFLRLYASLAVEAIAFIDERGTTVSIARLTGRDLAGRQTPATWRGAVEALGDGGLAEDDRAKRARAAGLLADLAEAVSVGSLEATDLKVKEVKGEDPLSFSIGRMSYAGGTEAAITLADVGFGAKEAQGKVGRLTLTGFSLEPTITALRRLAKAPAPADANPSKGAAPAQDPQEAELRRLTPVIGTLTLSDLGLDLAQAAVAPGPLASGDPLKAPKPVALPPLHIGLRGASMSFGPPKDGVPTESRFSLTGLTMPASAVEGVPGLGSLGLYGYRDLDLDATADTAWSEDKRELSFKELSLSGKDMGRLHLNATLGGIGPEVFDPDAAVSGFAMLSATAKALDLTLENGGLFERFIDAQAKVLSLKPDELRKEYVTASVIGVPVILGNSAAAKAIGAAMGKFVAKPGILSISAKAKSGEGLGMVDVSTAPTPAAVLDKLDVSAKAD